MSRYHQGKYTPINPKKYLGDPTNIVYRSSWERTFFRKCDLSNKIIAWSSEEIIIPYTDMTTGGIRRYFPDVFIAIKNSEGEVVKLLLEIKPEKEKHVPKKQGKKKGRQLYETKTYIKNQCKWNAAKAYCDKRGWLFKVITEKDGLF